VDNVQFATMMAALDNTVSTVNAVSYQVDALLGLVLALIFAVSFRAYL